MLPEIDSEPDTREQSRPASDATEESQARSWFEDLTGRRQTKIGREAGEPMNPLISGGAIAAALAADYLLFRFAFHTNYFHWYITYGAGFALALTVFSVAVELDDEPNLIAAAPSDYIGAWLGFFGFGFFWLYNVVKRARPDKHAESFDGPITALFAIAWTVAMFLWLAIIVPALYFVTFVCGAPIRQTRATTSKILIEAIPREIERSAKRKTFNIGLNVKKRPVTATNAIAAALLYALGFAV